VPNKQRLGAMAQMAPPLVERPWFLALQGVPLLAFVSALVWRKRTESLANNPRRRRRRQVAQTIRDGLVELRQLASEKKSDEFFATLFRLLQEQLGERLALPASAITEAVVEEHLRPRGVSETTLVPLQELFQTCNLARYAPIKTSQELAAIIPPARKRPAGTAGVKVVRLVMLKLFWLNSSCWPCAFPGQGRKIRRLLSTPPINCMRRESILRRRAPMKN